MSIDLYAKYIKEREGRDILILEHGFITYKKINKDLYYLVDCFVEEGYRQKGVARQLLDEVCAIALADGATKVLGSVCTAAEGVTTSLISILAGGFKFSSQDGNMLYFVKDL
jgi:GNAT superfamily N-acetyltransferase